MKKAMQNKERIFLILEKTPGQKATDIANTLGISRVSAYMHLKSLIDEGRVRRTGESRAVRYFLFDQVLQTQDILPEIQKLLYEKYEETVSTE